MTALWQGLLRWVTEGIDPALTCRRVGHDPDERERRGYRRVNDPGGKPSAVVAFRVVQRRQSCRRCGIALRLVHETTNAMSVPPALGRRDAEVYERAGEVWTA
jgi:hypothetical protein